MNSVVLLDTAPLVAFFSKRDANHHWAKQRINRQTNSMLTCEAVLSEACFLTERVLGNSDVVLEFVQRGAVKIGFNLEGEIDAVRSLMARYANVPMSLADACLVRISELYPSSLVLTTDSDFNIYRRHGRQSIPVIMPGM